jgi:hypothetical protein
MTMTTKGSHGRDAPEVPWASRFASIALANVVQEYPNHIVHLLNGPDDVRTPRALHPAFYGSYDWHSCVHMHWLLVRTLRSDEALAQRPDIARVLALHLTPANVAAEVEYLQRPGSQSFERPYGWAWLLALAQELAAAGAAFPEAARAADALGPLARTIVDRFVEFLPRAGYPVRYGMHANSAFALLLALDFARAGRVTTLEHGVVATARTWFGADRDLPIRWEPSGADFLSPALVEAHLMARVLGPDEFDHWLAQALPGAGTPAFDAWLVPAAVTDRSDPQIVHLDGLNLSRAWSLRGIARSLPAKDPRVKVLDDAADEHLQAGLRGLESEAYVGAHWLATFAALALDG